jgi:GT2 family glycosyltransferase
MPQHGLVIIIPTLNRRELLINLLKTLRNSTVIPEATYVVDSSDTFVELPREFRTINLKHVNSSVKSAAYQRNLAIEIILGEKLNFDFVAFLDDDIEIYPSYFEDLLRRFETNLDYVGISGHAISHDSKNRNRERTLWSDFIGLTGEPGSITKALVNVSPAGISEFSNVEWLIGCSMWRRVVIENFKFENDFKGQSLFEDVIFSYRAKSLGKIGFDPGVKFLHLLSTQERPSEKRHYQAWITNRYRIFRYSLNEFSKLRFWNLNIIIFLNCLIKAPFSSKERGKTAGIFLGIINLIILHRN